MAKIDMSILNDITVKQDFPVDIGDYVMIITTTCRIIHRVPPKPLPQILVWDEDEEDTEEPEDEENEEDKDSEENEDSEETGYKEEDEEDKNEMDFTFPTR